MDGSTRYLRLPFQLILFTGIWYFIIFIVLELALFAYKGIDFSSNYTSGTIAGEVILVLALAFVEIIRILLGWRGNLLENVLTTVFFILISVASLFGVLYLLIWQTIVLRADVILCAIELAFLGLQMLLAFIAIIVFARKVPY